LTDDDKENLLVLGDSHTQVFKSGRFPHNFPQFNWDVLTVIGATISGIDNPNSKTNAMQIYNERLEKRDFSKVILQLGEVDIGFVMWFKSQRDAIPISEYFDLTLTKYQEFIEKVRSYCENVMVVSVPLPTIRDGETLGKVANQRSNIHATQEERTKLTLKFNSLLKAYCESTCILYLDLDYVSLGDDGLVSDRLRNKDKADHHYCKFAYSEVLVENLKKVIANGW